MNLQLSHQMTAALTTSHSGSENDTIKSSSFKGLGEVRVEKAGTFFSAKTPSFLKCIHVGGDVKDDIDMVFLVPDNS